MSSRTTTGKIFSTLAVAALLLGAGTAMGTGDGWWDGVGNPDRVGMFQVLNDPGGYLFDTPEVGIMTDTGTTQSKFFAWKDWQPMTKAEGWTMEFALKLTGDFVSAYNFFTAFGDDTNEVNMWWRSDQAGLDVTPDGFVAMAELYDGDFHTIRVEREAGADAISISIDGEVRRIIEMPSGAAGDRALFSYYGTIGQWDYIKWSSPSSTLFPPEPAGPTVEEQINDLQAQIDAIALTPGAQGPQGKQGADGAAGTAGAAGTDGAAGADGADGAAGADAPCKSCDDVAGSAVDLACLVIGANPPSSVSELQAAAATIAESLLISANICEPDNCDLSDQIDAAIDAKLNP